MLPYRSFFSWNLGPITIQSFGLMFSIAILVAIYFILKEFKTKKQQDHIYNITIIAIIAGIAGARIVYVIENWSIFSGNLLSMFNFIDGGLSWFGGLIGGFLGVALYLKLKKLDFWRYADVFAPSLAIGQAVGRIGCILGDGGHVGKLTNMPWGFNVNGEIRHVTAWYSAINLVILFLILRKLKASKPFKGFLFLFYLTYYSTTRFIIDLLRIDQRYFGLTLTQYICVVIFFTSGTLLIKNMNKNKKGKKPKKKSKSKSISTELCPQCKSENISLYMGGQFGKYKCKKCAYIGPLIIKKEEK